MLIVSNSLSQKSHLALAYSISKTKKKEQKGKKKLSFFQTSKLISNCPPLYDEVGEMVDPVAILLFWSRVYLLSIMLKVNPLHDKI